MLELELARDFDRCSTNIWDWKNLEKKNSGKMEKSSLLEKENTPFYNFQPECLPRLTEVWISQK